MPRFRKAILLHNPKAGKGRHAAERIAEIERAARGLAAEVIVEPTRAAGSGGQQARSAIDAGCDLVIAAGGDGTVFDVLQGVAQTSATLAVVPLGTGNVLAIDLGLSGDAVTAARMLADCEVRRIALGRIRCADHEPRFFTVAAGVGVHAELVYDAAAAKQRGGIAAYYFSGFHRLFTHKFEPFEVEVTAVDGRVTRDQVLELVAMRVSSFGRWLKRWRPGSSLLSPDLQLVVLRESTRTAMVRYVVGAFTGRAHRDDKTSRSADVRFISVKSVRCTVAGATAIRAQADGEVLGTMPVELEIVPDALSILMPTRTTSD